MDPPQGRSTCTGDPALPTFTVCVPQGMTWGPGPSPTTWPSTKIRCPADQAGALISPVVEGVEEVDGSAVSDADGDGGAADSGEGALATVACGGGAVVRLGPDGTGAGAFVGFGAAGRTKRLM